MKKLLLVFLLAILPLQASWAAAAAYCQHGAEVNTSHFGHHEHKHDAEHVVTQAEEGQKSSAVHFHADCVTCHGLAVALFMPVVNPSPSGPFSEMVVTNIPSLKSISSARPEKPQWVLAV